ncbi:N-acetyltransferase [Nostocoides sp. HKS02]|uniref:GNAT family N-acetyltransferase n=1 Tax=Nostocoides sp. HKS02 TaxID=1813880 RepID=UPI0012B4F797|nr:GNAT family N-acetyltransferase [Tetrasphaera sp. HKS02]QGN58344.1 GNAT family N-acetyltransferase [Tetrasphaera sp. HKS02]
MTDRSVGAPPVCRLEPPLWRVYRGVRLAMLLDEPQAFGSTFAREVQLSDDEWRARAAGAPTWLAHDAELPVGAVTLFRYPEQAADEACLVAMWVAAHARGRGVADALVGALLEHARSVGLRRVTLDVAHANGRAIGFYERMGFTPTGREGALAHDPAVTELELEHVLA